MSDPHKTYRIYCYDAAQNILSVDVLDATSDAEAIAAANASGFGSQCEIWEGKRLVAQLSETDRKSA